MASEDYAQMVLKIDQLIQNAEAMCEGVEKLEKEALIELEKRQDELLAEINQISKKTSQSPTASELKIRSEIAQKLGYFQQLNHQFVHDLSERYAMIHVDDSTSDGSKVMEQIDRIKNKLGRD